MFVSSASTRRVVAMAATRWVLPTVTSSSSSAAEAAASSALFQLRAAASTTHVPKFGSTVDVGSRYFSSKAPEGEEEEKKNPDAAAGDTEGGEQTKEEAEAPSADGSAEADANPSKEEELEAQVKELKNQLLRAMAEQENIRSISRRDVDSAKQYAIKSFAKSLLETADNLNRALDAVPEEYHSTDGDDPAAKTLANLYEGVAMTRSGLTKALAQNGVKSYSEQPGEPFDPNRHNALMRYPDPSKEPNTVGQVISCGYTLHDRVLRPAEVGVVQDTK